MKSKKTKAKRNKIPFIDAGTLHRFKKIDLGRRVYVYKNCRDKCLSIRQGKKVIAHTDEIHLSNVQFFTNSNARKCGYGISGYIDNQTDFLTSMGDQVVYDPRAHNSFVKRETFEVVKISPNAKISVDKGITIPSM